MQVINNKGVAFCQAENLNKLKFMHHGFSTKIGGISGESPREHLAYMNLGFTRGDLRENVLKNFDIMGNAMGFDSKNIVFSSQIHKTAIYVATDADRGKGITRLTDLEIYDGLITNCPNVVLTTFHADCVPLFFADTENNAIGLAHAGWRGTVNNIAGEIIKKMAEVYGTKPKNLVAAIGPAIGNCCFQVDTPVYEEFIKKIPESDKFMEKGPKFNIDLKQINKLLMCQAGVLASNIEVSNLCTMCQSHLFYSHRRDGEKRGSMAAFMEIVENRGNKYE